jgi:RNA polymerase sigma factor (sigma-70 family)
MEAVAGLPAFERPNTPRMFAGQSRKKDEDEIMAAEPGSDLDLLARVTAGETAALRSLYETHGARLYAYALRVSGNPAVAEDIIQDSLLAIWKDAAKFRGEGRVIAWLLGIVHHKAMNAVRGRRTFPLDDEADDIPSDILSPEEAVVRGERKDLIKAGLDRLSWKHRLVLDLVFFQGLSLAETATVCGCPLGTVKSRLNQAKSGLRAVLEPNNPGEKPR